MNWPFQVFVECNFMDGEPRDLLPDLSKCINSRY